MERQVVETGKRTCRQIDSKIMRQKNKQTEKWTEKRNIETYKNTNRETNTQKKPIQKKPI